MGYGKGREWILGCFLDGKDGKKGLKMNEEWLLIGAFEVCQFYPCLLLDVDVVFVCTLSCYFSYLVHYSNQMKAAARRGSPIPSRHAQSKRYDESTRIHHSHSTTLPHNRTSFPFHAHTNTLPSKFHNCCSAIHTHSPSFQPSISALPFQLYPQQQALSKSRQEHWQDIIQDTRMRNMQRTEQKLQEEENRLKECTFAPIITPFLYLKSSQEVHEKLYDQAQKRRQQRMQAEIKAKQKQREELQCFGHEPDPSKWKLLNSERFDLEPLYKRLEKVIEEKRRSRKMIAEKEQSAYSFRPQLSEETKKIASRKQKMEGVVDRLIAEFAKRGDRMGLLREGREAQLRKECTFTPAVNNYIPNDTYKGRRENKQKYGEYLFSPVINPLSALITQDRKNQSQEERFFRMIDTPMIRRAEKIGAVQAQLYAECCFNPQINDISRHMHGGGQKHHVCEFRQPDSPTYRPIINHTSRIMSEAKRAKSLENIRQKNRAKQESYKKEVEYLQMRECTFRPKVKNDREARVAVQKGRTLQEVAGVKQFMENREKYNQKERAKKELEERLFQLQKSYDLRMGTKKQIGKKQP